MMVTQIMEIYSKVINHFMVTDHAIERYMQRACKSEDKRNKVKKRLLRRLNSAHRVVHRFDISTKRTKCTYLMHKSLIFVLRDDNVVITVFHSNRREWLPVVTTSDSKLVVQPS